MLVKMKSAFEKSLIPVIENKPAYHAVGIRGTHQLTEGLIPTIVDQWKLFMSRIEEIHNRRAATVGVCYGVHDGGPFGYITGVLVDESHSGEPESMCRISLEPQTYAIFTHTGPTAELGTTFKTIEGWVDSNGTYKRVDAPDFEYYDHRFTGNDRADSEFDIYIPVVLI
jgi:AraC family transcriptional regulator